ncbi:class I SAM-dependent methyltransferase [Nitrosarchaeum sp. AC2]|uniref:class I SAM-dependent methyltransferase n=1 Tax=Nitrosarchaeum sp. AC2 TaxID=2259673 RepID=UPI0015CD07AC|nr:methyltransferase domain-containing protein [Nitrosarchaeum sp. AC2]QLH10207.1 hypothetical protein DSQ20_00810 [Nitrosarchaeum sp. AC2]
MNFQYNCPECKDELLKVENKLYCNNCHNDYVQENNCVDFKNYDSRYNVKNEMIMKELLLDVEQNGYKEGIRKFLVANNKFKSYFSNLEYDKSIDVIFHGIGKNCLRCLNIKNEFGNKAEILSNIFKQVYTIEFDDYSIEFQKKRFDEGKCSNISIAKCDLLKLPFPDGYFDLILCNDILDNISNNAITSDKPDSQKQIITELKRVVNEKGCIIFGVDNDRGLKIKWKESGNNLRVNSSRKFSEYLMILQNSGMSVKSYWALPTYNTPYYSGEIFDKISLKAFFRNISIFISTLRGGKKGTKKMEMMLYLLKNMNYYLMKKGIQIFAPSFVFCCRKGDNSGSLENWIKKETGYKNILRMSRHEKILFMLLNVNGIIEKSVYIRRFGYEIPSDIKFFERNYPNIKEPEERMWIVNWLNGRPVNPNNKNEIFATLNWLIEFQKKNKLEKMNKDNIQAEIMFIKNGLEYFQYTNVNEYFDWLKEYVQYIENYQIRMTPVHGDFWFPNVLYDTKTKKINVIDWETFSEKGNPFEDFMWFLCNLMGMSSKDPVLKFKENLEGNSKMNKILDEIKNQINLHFGFKLNYTLLMRINLLKWMIIQEQIREKSLGRLEKIDECESIHLKILNVLSEHK